MYEYVHIDEKWFYITKQNTGYYLVPGEPDPIRTCKSKRFVTKVMFMAAVARPRYDHHRNKMFDGKIGIWPFAFQDVAQRNSRNRPAGTLVTKIVPNINRDEIRKMFSENIIPHYLLCPNGRMGIINGINAYKIRNLLSRIFLNLVLLMWQSNYFTRGRREGQSVKNNVLDYSREVLETFMKMILSGMEDWKSHISDWKKIE